MRQNGALLGYLVGKDNGISFCLTTTTQKLQSGLVIRGNKHLPSCHLLPGHSTIPRCPHRLCVCLGLSATHTVSNHRSRNLEGVCQECVRWFKLSHWPPRLLGGGGDPLFSPDSPWGSFPSRQEALQEVSATGICNNRLC